MPNTRDESIIIGVRVVSIPKPSLMLPKKQRKEKQMWLVYSGNLATLIAVHFLHTWNDK